MQLVLSGSQRSDTGEIVKLRKIRTIRTIRKEKATYTQTDRLKHVLTIEYHATGVEWFPNGI